MTNNPNCKYCNSEATTKFGTYIPKRKSYIRKKKRRYKPKEVKEKEYTSSRIIDVRK